MSGTFFVRSSVGGSTCASRVRRTWWYALFAMMVCATGAARAQSPYDQNTKSLVLWNGNTVSQKYLALSTVAGLATNYRLWLPATAPIAGNLLRCSVVSSPNDTLVWGTAAIGSGSPTQVAFWSVTGALSGSDSLWWDNTNGRLGIGTKTPTQRVHVLGGTVLIDDSSSGVAGKLMFENPLGSAATSIAAGAQTATLGYTLPGAQGAANSMLTNNGSGTLTWAAPVVSAWFTTGNSGTTPGTNYLGTNDTQAVVIKTNSVERARVTTSGQFAIGITSPSATLHAVATDAVTNAVTTVQTITHNSSGTAGANFGVAQKFQLATSSTANRDAAQLAAIWQNATHASRSSALTFSTTRAATLGERVRIDSSGYVGVATTGPATSLDINGGFATRYALLSLSNGTNNDVALGSGTFFICPYPTANFTLTGLSGGVDGRRVRIANTSGHALTIANLSTLSASANRIVTGAGADVTSVGTMSMYEFIYDGSQNHWVLGDLNPTLGTVGSSLYVTKGSDQSITNSAVLTNDNDLVLAMPANEQWELNGEVQAINSSNSVDMLVAFTVPTGASIKIFFTGVGTTGGTAVAGCDVLKTSGSSSRVNLTAGVSTLISFRGIVTIGSTSGNLQFQWCQNVANNSATTVNAKSYLKITRIN